MTETPTLYRRYLALDQATNRLRACDVQITRYAFSGEGSTLGEDYWRSKVDRDIEEGEVPSLYRYADMTIYIKDFLDYSLATDAREQQAQERREKLIRDFVKLYPDTIVARYKDGQSYLYWEPFEGMGVSVQVGRALCERVLVGEDETFVPDPELTEKALESVPLVKKVVPRYEWRCNDAEFGLKEDVTQ